MASVTVDGLSELQKSMKTLEENLASPAVAKRALRAGAEPMLEQIQQNARSELHLGSKRNLLYPSLEIGSMKARGTGYTMEIGSFMRALRYKVFYAWFVEFGHGGPQPAPPHPFVRPAYDVKVDESYREMQNVLNDEINKIL